MAFSVVPFALQNVPISADIVRQAASSLVPAGGGLVQYGELKITQTSTASMNVVISAGRCWIPGTVASLVPGTVFSDQAQYFVQNDGTVTASIATANATNPRIDTVYVAVEDAFYTGTNNDVSNTYVVTGTPAPSPVAPAAPSNSIVLATVLVGANVSSITNANITNVARVINAGTAYTPTWSGPGSWGTGGSITGLYQVNGNIVTLYTSLVAGSGTSLPAGIVTFTLPTAYPMTGGLFHVGTGLYRNTGGGIRPMEVICAPGSNPSLWSPQNNADSLNPGAAGWAWGNGYSFEARIQYQTNG